MHAAMSVEACGGNARHGATVSGAVAGMTASRGGLS